MADMALNTFTKYCRCSGFDGGMRIGEDGKIYCTKCGLPIDDYVEGLRDFDAEVIEFPKREDSPTKM